MQAQPFLVFDGVCEEALGFYRRALGAELGMLQRYKDSPDPSMVPAGNDDKIMYAELRVGDTLVLASDGRCQGHPSFHGFALSLTVKDEAEADRVFAALAEGGEVRMPLAQTFFSARFGMVADRFGVVWMVFVAPKE